MLRCKAASACAYALNVHGSKPLQLHIVSAVDGSSIELAVVMQLNRLLLGIHYERWRIEKERAARQPRKNMNESTVEDETEGLKGL